MTARRATLTTVDGIVVFPDRRENRRTYYLRTGR
jgi:hypothetical protein